MAMLFDYALDDDFGIEEFHKFASEPLSYNAYDLNVKTDDIWDKFTLLPTPPLSPDQQLELKEEPDQLIDVESNFYTTETMTCDTEVECYLNYQPSHYVINDKNWCDNKLLTSTPNPIETDPFLKLRTPTLDIGQLTTHHIRPITPQTPIKVEIKSDTPVKVYSPQRPHVIRISPPKYNIMRIKEEPQSPPPIRTTAISSFSEIRTKEEPARYIPGPPYLPETMRVKRRTCRKQPVEKPRKVEQPKKKQLTRLRNVRLRRVVMTTKRTDVKRMTVKSKPKLVKIEEVQQPTVIIQAPCKSGEHDISEVYLKRKLAEISATTASQHRTRHTSNHAAHALAEHAANNLSLEELRNLSASHSHAEDEPCAETCTKRFAHNVLERKRRNDLTRSYEMLQEAVPSICDTERVAKVVILKKSAEYIETIAEEDQVLKRELRDIKAHQRKLIDKLRSLYEQTQKQCKHATK